MRGVLRGCKKANRTILNLNLPYLRFNGIRVKTPSKRSGTSLDFCHFQDDWLHMNGVPLTVAVPHSIRNPVLVAKVSRMPVSSLKARTMLVETTLYHFCVSLRLLMPVDFIEILPYCSPIKRCLYVPSFSCGTVNLKLTFL